MKQKSLAILLLLSYFSVVLHDVIPHDHHEDVVKLTVSGHDHDHNDADSEDHDHEHAFSEVFEHMSFDSADHHHHQGHSHLTGANFFRENRLDQKENTERIKSLTQPNLILLHALLVDDFDKDDAAEYRDELVLYASQIHVEANSLRGPPSLV